MLVELCLKPLEERKRVGGRARKPGKDAVAIETAYLARRRLDNNVAKGHLAIAAESHRRAATHR